MAELAGYSLSWLEAEVIELRKDLTAFSSSYDIIRRRLLESAENNPSRSDLLEKWSGTWATLGALELSTRFIEKNIREVSELIEKVRSGELQNVDKKPSLKIVKEGIDA